MQSGVGAKPEAPGGHAASAAWSTRVVVDMYGGSLMGAADGSEVGESLTGDAVGLFVGGLDTGDTDGLKVGEGVDVACTTGLPRCMHATWQEHGQLSMSSSTCSWVKPISTNWAHSKNEWAWHGKFNIDRYAGESRHQPSKQVPSGCQRSESKGASKVKLVSCVS